MVAGECAMNSVAMRARSRDLLELAVGYGLILAVLWTPRPWQRMVYWVPVAWIAVTSSLSFAGWAAMGWRKTNLLRSLWIVGAALGLAVSAAFVAKRMGTLHLPDGPWSFFKTYVGYAIWSFVQQFLLLDFFLGRLLRVVNGKATAVCIAAGMFALAHLPNPVLASLTLLWGTAACLLFLRYRNLYPLGLAHAIFGICVAVTIPGYVTHNMRVGLGYLRYHPRGHRQRSHSDQMVSTRVWVSADAATRRS